MTNTLQALLNGALLIMNLVLMVSVVLRKDKVKFDYVYIFACALIILWQLCELATSFVPDPTLVAYFYTMKAAFIVFIPPTFLYLVVWFYGIKGTFPQWVISAYFALAAGIALCAFSSIFYNLFYSSITVTATASLTRIEAVPTAFYYFTMVFALIPVAGFTTVILVQRRKLPVVYRFAVTLLIWGIIAFVLSFVAFVSGAFSDSGIDFSLVGTCMFNFMFFVAAAGEKHADYLNVWRGDVFDYLDEAIFILNDKGVVVEANLPAKRLFGSLGIAIDNEPIDEFWKNAAATGKVFLRQLEGEDQVAMSRDMYVIDGDYPMIYEIQHSPMLDETKAGSGEFVVFTEVTRNRLYIERLQDLAGVDSLTGLPNRFSYEKALPMWDKAENLPLSFIVGDVNGLKATNDEQGHRAGDELLIDAAAVLQRSCPPDGMVARIGGDEFVMLLKNSGAAEAQSVIDDIDREIRALPQEHRTVSIALGSATKTSPTENLNELYRQADRRMYENKRAGGPST